MNILYITPYPLSYDYGGGMHATANLLSLASSPLTNKIDILCPAINSELFESYSDKIAKVEIVSSKISDKVYSLLTFNATKIYARFKKVFLPKIKTYDLIFIESTLCGFVFNQGHSLPPVISCIHNVEQDYQRVNNKGLRKNFLSYTSHISERITLKYSDIILALHQGDLRRIEQIYGTIPSEKVFFHSVCTFNKMNRTNNPLISRPLDLLYIGGLNRISNENSILEFLNICWGELAPLGINLSIAGRNPGNTLLDKCLNLPSVQVFPNPTDITTLINNAKLFILPDLFGCGMKVRVAESLSCGTPVIGTQLGLEGYDDCDSYGRNVNDIKSMVLPIKQAIRNPEILEQWSRNALKYWENNYSFEIFESRIHKIIAATIK